jgi:hypothetical protein
LKLAQQAIPYAHIIAWSIFRRSHQAAAKEAHLKAQIQRLSSVIEDEGSVYERSGNPNKIADYLCGLTSPITEAIKRETNPFLFGET